MQPGSPSSDDAPSDHGVFGGTTRRRLLRASVNTAVGAGIVWGAGSTTRDETVSVPYAHARTAPGSDGLEERTKQVPADWHESLQTAFAVQRRIAETELSSILGSFVVPGSYRDPSASLTVEGTSDRIGEEIAEVVESVPVDVEVVDELPPQSDGEEVPDAPLEVADLDDTHIPGGVVCESRDASGTLMPALYEADSGERFFGTSNHVFGRQGTMETEHEGEPLYLRRGQETRRIGRVKRGYPIDDLARISPVNGSLPVSEIERAEPSTVIGQYTRVGLADLMARNEPLEKVGAWSGHTTGSILGVDGVTCYTSDFCRSSQLKWGDSETMTGGDSGSVNYHPDPENPDEYLLVGGINNARSWWPEADYTWGTAAYDLLEKHGLHF